MPRLLNASSNAPALLLCLLVAAGGLLSTGCGNSPAEDGGFDDPPVTRQPDDGSSAHAVQQGPSSVSGDSVFARLQAVNDTAIVEAFRTLEGASYVRRLRTEQLTAEGDLIAFRQHTIDQRGNGTRVLERDSAGTFDYGYLGRFSQTEPTQDNASELAAQIVPDDPAYLSPRSREGYEYSMGIDTLAGVGPVDVIDIRAHPEHGDDYAIRRARLYLEPETGRVIAQRIARTDQALWFRESTDLFISIRHDASAGWVPHQTRIETRIRMPLRPTQRFLTHSTFEDVSPHEAGESIVTGDAGQN